MRISRLLVHAALGVLVLGVVLVGMTLWRFWIPSAAARQLAGMYAARPQVPDADNAYFYVWGLTAAADMDPLVEAGKRVAWLRRKSADPDLMEPDPGTELPSIGERRSDRMRQLAKSCGDGASRACAAAFDAWPIEEPLSDIEVLQAARYAELIKRPRWAEAVPFDATATLPPFAEVLDGQRVELLQLRAAATAGDGARVRQVLDRDFVFWREVQKSSYSLITKMIACAAIRNHFFFGNLLLRELPPAQRTAAIPPSWRVPVSAEERGMFPVLSGEYEFARVTLTRRLDPNALDDDDDDEDLTIDNWLLGWGDRLWPLQKDLNSIARVYVDTAESFEVPLDQYSRAARALEARIPRSGRAAMNASHYAERVGALEGVRRAALLTAELRGRGVPADQVASALVAPAPGNPFTGAPFEWSTAQQAVIFEGMENHAWNRHVFFY